MLIQKSKAKKIRPEKGLFLGAPPILLQNFHLLTKYLQAEIQGGPTSPPPPSPIRLAKGPTF